MKLFSLIILIFITNFTQYIAKADDQCYYVKYIQIIQHPTELNASVALEYYDWNNKTYQQTTYVHLFIEIQNSRRTQRFLTYINNLVVALNSGFKELNSKADVLRYVRITNNMQTTDIILDIMEKLKYLEVEDIKELQFCKYSEKELQRIGRLYNYYNLNYLLTAMKYAIIVIICVVVEIIILMTFLLQIRPHPQNQN